MALTNISLRIYGGALNNGFNDQPLVAVGTAPATFKPVPPTIVNEQHVWMITHAQDYTYYAAYSTRCRTTTDQPGQMLICLFFPPQMRLAEGNSPLGLLDSLTDCFAVQALRGGMLPDTPVDSSPFKALLGRYRLEQRPVALPVMSGHEPAAFCVSNRAQLDALLRHSRYPVLAAVGTLELGFHCTSTIQLFASGTKTSTQRSKTETQTPKPDNNQSNHTIHTEQSEQQKTVYQNHGLETESELEDEQPNSHKKLKVLAICAAIIIVLIIAIASLGGEDDSQQVAVNDSTSVVTDTMASEVSENNGTHEKEPIHNDIAQNQQETQHENIGKIKPNNNPEIEAKKLAAMKEAKKKAEAEAKKKALAEAKKKAEAEAKKKAEIEAKKKSEAQNSAWQASIRSKAASCPIQLRVGVHITSISYTNNSVTFTVKYDELSKYNMYSEDRDRLASDRSSVLSKYASGLPSGVRKSVVQKDKAGRTL